MKNPRKETDPAGTVARRIADGVLLGGILIVLLAGLGRTIFFPREINEYENRYANRLPALTAQGVLDGSFQQGVDSALSDQVYFSTTCKRTYNSVSSRYLNSALKPLWSSLENEYVNYLGMRVFGPEHHIIYDTRSLEEVAPALDQKAENYNRAIARNPETEFYLYFIEKDTDIEFMTGAKPGLYEYFRSQLHLDDDHAAKFAVDGFSDFSQYFYRTDHHWNNRGSYRGYRQVAELLGVEDAPIEAGEEVTLPNAFVGSKAFGLGAESFSEPFSLYRFSFPAMEVTRNGEPAENYGSQEYFLTGTAGTPTYGRVYGGDDGEIVFSTGRSDRENILVLGESFDNAILKLLASHFNRTYSVDLRYYEAYMGKPFSLDEYLAEHEIDKVLWIGNLDCFIMQEFMLEG